MMATKPKTRKTPVVCSPEAVPRATGAQPFQATGSSLLPVETLPPRKTPVAATCVNPKLLALAAKADVAETELKRVLTDVREPADLRFFANREDKAAQAAMKVADAAEGAALDASGMAAEKFSNFRATNLEELILKARRADVDFIDDVVARSIVDDLLAIGGKP